MDKWGKMGEMDILNGMKKMEGTVTKRMEKMDRGHNPKWRKWTEQT